jgi:uncharacterized protein DUF6468
VSNYIGLMIESLVAILLLLTIGYCFVLNRRLKGLRGDELALKATIAELITATEIAERAIAGLKLTVRDCDSGLGERLRQAERLDTDLAEKLAVGEEVLNRLRQIAVAARVQPELTPETVAPDAQAIVKAAQAFAARTRAKTYGVAA